MSHPKGSLTKILITLGLASALSLHPAKLLADTITWTAADGTSFAGGGELSGSFDCDTLDNVYSNVDIVAGNDEGTLEPVFVPGDTYNKRRYCEFNFLRT